MNTKLLQIFLNGKLELERKAELAKSNQLTLGELILKCEAIQDTGQIVVFDKDNLGRPGAYLSWRGIYSELAITPQLEGSIKFGDFLEMSRASVGTTFEGYKGGEFVMSRHTPVWVAEYGWSGNTQIVDVKAEPDRVVLMTEDKEPYE